MWQVGEGAEGYTVAENLNSGGNFIKQKMGSCVQREVRFPASTEGRRAPSFALMGGMRRGERGFAHGILVLNSVLSILMKFKCWRNSVAESC